MKTHQCVVTPPLGSNAVYSELLLDHSWLAPWVVRVSSGLADVVRQLLEDIEDVLGPEPKISFLRVVEKPMGKRDPFARKLEVFIQPEVDIDALINALASVVSAAIGTSLVTCYLCGDTLDVMKDKSEWESYKFLADVGHGESFCLRCSEKQWHEDARKKNSVACEADDEETQEDDSEALESAALKPNKKANIENTGSATRSKRHQTPDDEWGLIDSFLHDDSDEDEDDESPQQAVAVAGPTISVFCPDAVDKLEKNNKDAPRDQLHRVRRIVAQMRESGYEKRLAMARDDWRDYCEILAEKFPNFADVTAFIRNQFALSAAGDGALRLPPMLLVGGPGVGKTEFLLTLANDLKTTLEVIDMSCAQTGSALTGSEAYWGNTQTGQLFNTLAYGDIANPLMLLDEIDKARGDERYNPLSALHQLLEPRQAKIYHDLSVPELTIDASHVIWVATANHLEGMAKPIIDRFTVFTIADPTPAQMISIVKNQYQRFLNNHPSGAYFDADMSQEVLAELSHHHPRKVRKMLEQAFGLAALDCRRSLSVEDIRASDIGERRRHGMGFLAQTNH